MVARRKPARQPVTRSQTARKAVIATALRRNDGVKRIKQGHKQEYKDTDEVLDTVIGWQREFLEEDPSDAGLRASLARNLRVRSAIMAPSERLRNEGVVMLAASARQADQRRAARRRPKRRVVRGRR